MKTDSFGFAIALFGVWVGTVLYYNYAYPHSPTPAPEVTVTEIVWDNCEYIVFSHSSTGVYAIHKPGCRSCQPLKPKFPLNTGLVFVKNTF